MDWGYATIDADINYVPADGLYHMLIKKEGGTPGIFAATATKLTGLYKIKDENDYVKFEGNKSVRAALPSSWWATLPGAWLHRILLQTQKIPHLSGRRETLQLPLPRHHGGRETSAARLVHAAHRRRIQAPAGVVGQHHARKSRPPQRRKEVKEENEIIFVKTFGKHPFI